MWLRPTLVKLAARLLAANQNTTLQRLSSSCTQKAQLAQQRTHTSIRRTKMHMVTLLKHVVAQKCFCSVHGFVVHDDVHRVSPGTCFK